VSGMWAANSTGRLNRFSLIQQFSELLVVYQRMVDQAANSGSLVNFGVAKITRAPGMDTLATYAGLSETADRDRINTRLLSNMEYCHPTKQTVH
jgi:hypothetical protein